MKSEFMTFQKEGGKFRVAVTEQCNLNCFFCHNEGMQNPRQGGKQSSKKFPLLELAKIVNSYIQLGGKQVNITGGEPLLLQELPEFLEQIEKQSSILVLNTNAIYPNPLLNHPLQEKLDCLLISLHTTNEDSFQKWLGKPKAQKLRENIVLLKEKGYTIQLNYSLGNYNAEDFESVLRFAVEQQVLLKVITIIRHDTKENFYYGEWKNPDILEETLVKYNAQKIHTKNSLGGKKTEYKVNETTVIIKNIGNGRLVTDYCKGCSYIEHCGEGIYGLRVGVDGIWKPCLLNKEKYTPLKQSEDYQEQILAKVQEMIGDWKNAEFLEGTPC